LIIGMQRNFDIKLGIYLVQPLHELDLHNFFDFEEVHYSVAQRVATLRRHRSRREGVSQSLPERVQIDFREVSAFRFHPRDPEVPFTEDNCLRDAGYWVDEDWAKGIIICDSPDQADPNWFTAFEFMSGAMIAVQAASAYATITG
jgi:hypothetical protein